MILENTDDLFSCDNWLHHSWISVVRHYESAVNFNCSKYLRKNLDQNLKQIVEIEENKRKWRIREIHNQIISSASTVSKKRQMVEFDRQMVWTGLDCYEKYSRYEFANALSFLLERRMMATNDIRSSFRLEIKIQSKIRWSLIIIILISGLTIKNFSKK